MIVSCSLSQGLLVRRNSFHAPGEEEDPEGQKDVCGVFFSLLLCVLHLPWHDQFAVVAILWGVEFSYLFFALSLSLALTAHSTQTQEMKARNKTTCQHLWRLFKAIGPEKWWIILGRSADPVMVGLQGCSYLCAYWVAVACTWEFPCLLEFVTIRTVCCVKKHTTEFSTHILSRACMLC